MATSGTVGATTIDVTTIIEHAARRCGVLAPSLSAEQQLSAKENLFFLLSDLANRGVSLWCVQRTILGLALNQAAYNLPVGTVDVLNCMYRTMTYPTGTTSSTSTTQAIDFGSGNDYAINTIGIVPTSAATYNLVVETSTDGASWTTFYTVPSFTTTANLPYWFDLEPTTTSQYWRIRETVLASLDVSSASFGNTPLEITMSPYNRDEYSDLPNKAFPGRPLQYWYDKQYQVPRLYLWPVPEDTTAQVVVWNQRQIQDVGALTNTLEVPQRWLEGIIFLIASRMAMELPPEKLPPGRIELLMQQAEYHLKQAEDGERDGAPIRIAPRISAYTR